MNLIEKLDELEKAATPGPWNHYDDADSTGRQEIVALGKTVSRIYAGNSSGKADAELITELRNAWPKLRAAVLLLKDERVTWNEDYCSGTEFNELYDFRNQRLKLLAELDQPCLNT
jgi:hypothetical protein